MFFFEIFTVDSVTARPIWSLLSLSPFTPLPTSPLFIEEFSSGVVVQPSFFTILPSIASLPLLSLLSLPCDVLHLSPPRPCFFSTTVTVAATAALPMPAGFFLLFVRHPGTRRRESTYKRRLPKATLARRCRCRRDSDGIRIVPCPRIFHPRIPPTPEHWCSR